MKETNFRLTSPLYLAILLLFPSLSSQSPEPKPWPPQFHSILVINSSKGLLQVTDLWYDWPNGRNFNIIQHQLGKKLYDLEWDNGTSYYYTLDENQECNTRHFPVGILRPDWLDAAEYVGQVVKDGFLCNVWKKVDFITYYEDVATKRPVYWAFFSDNTEMDPKRQATIARKRALQKDVRAKKKAARETAAENKVAHEAKETEEKVAQAAKNAEELAVRTAKY